MNEVLSGASVKTLSEAGIVPGFTSSKICTAKTDVNIKNYHYLQPDGENVISLLYCELTESPIVEEAECVQRAMDHKGTHYSVIQSSAVELI